MALTINFDTIYVLTFVLLTIFNATKTYLELSFLLILTNKLLNDMFLKVID